MSYTDMASDVLALIDHLSLDNLHLVGHSMGGKISMRALQLNPAPFKSATIVDIAPKNYDHHHQHILDAMQGISLNSCQTRTDIDEALKKFLPHETDVRQLLLKNISREPGTNSFKWVCNTNAIQESYADIMKKGVDDTVIHTPTLCISGGSSSYVKQSDHALFKEIFSSIRFKAIPKAGHWVQAEAAHEFLSILTPFIENHDTI